MDTLYIGDIPKEYHFAVFNGDYITLYNTDRFYPDNTYDYYRIYNHGGGFYYVQGETRINNYNTLSTQDIQVSDNWLYRQDIDKIFTVVFIICIMFIFVFNIVTSVFKKGGVLGGLL